MWEISKTPAASRTALCSSEMLVYCTGICQPPKSTMRAPSLRCASNRAVFLSEAGSVLILAIESGLEQTSRFNKALVQNLRARGRDEQRLHRRTARVGAEQLRRGTYERVVLAAGSEDAKLAAVRLVHAAIDQLKIRG